MITRTKYVEYLISTPINYTCSNLANHLEGVSHDVVTDYLNQERLTARHLWELVQPFIQDSPEAYLLIDDSVQNKQYARSMELVKRQYSGAEGGVVPGCRKQRAQRNHLACFYHAWLTMKVKAAKLQKTIYQVKADLLTDYLRAELRSPRIPALQAS
jgi:hypothetical protein